MTSTARLFKHGEFVAPEAQLLGDKSGLRMSLLQQFDKKNCASEMPHAFGGIRRIYQDIVDLYNRKIVSREEHDSEDSLHKARAARWLAR